MNRIKIIASCLLVSISVFQGTAQQKLKLHYDKPSTNWNEALPMVTEAFGGARKPLFTIIYWPITIVEIHVWAKKQEKPLL